MVRALGSAARKHANQIQAIISVPNNTRRVLGVIIDTMSCHVTPLLVIFFIPQQNDENPCFFTHAIVFEFVLVAEARGSSLKRRDILLPLVGATLRAEKSLWKMTIAIRRLRCRVYNSDNICVMTKDVLIAGRSFSLGLPFNAKGSLPGYG